MRGLQPRWPLVLRSLQLPHAFYTSTYLEVIAVLHYNNHDGVIRVCVSKACISSKYSKCINAIKRILYTTAKYTASYCFVHLCFFLFTPKHVKSLAFCVLEWRRSHNIIQSYKLVQISRRLPRQTAQKNSATARISFEWSFCICPHYVLSTFAPGVQVIPLKGRFGRGSDQLYRDDRTTVLSAQAVPTANWYEEGRTWSNYKTFH